MSENRFIQQTFESIAFLIQTLQKEKIKAGGSSSSSVINRYIASLSQDVLLLATRSNKLANRADRVNKAASIQSAALLSAWQSVSTRVDAASGYSQVLADIHSTFYVDTGSTTATLSSVFGQATLPVQSTTDLLIQTDVYGNPSIFSEVEVAYATGSEPNNLAYSIDVDALEMLKGQQLWVLPEQAATGWIKIKAPLQYRGLTPNVLEIYPLPAFGLDLQEVAYQKAGDSFSSTWVALDLSYLPGWNSATSQVDQVGPIRLHLPNLPISQIRIKLSPRASTSWGLYKLKLYHVEYESSATLVVQDPYSRTIGNSTIRGKDPSTLSLLSKTTAANKVTINMTTTDSSTTPVITGAILSV